MQNERSQSTHDCRQTFGLRAAFGCLLFNKRKAFRRAVVGRGNGYAVRYALGRVVEKAGRIATDRGIDRIVGLGELSRRFGFEVGVIALFISCAERALRNRYVARAAAIAVIVTAVFLTAFKIVHDVLLHLTFCSYSIVTAARFIRREKSFYVDSAEKLCYHETVKIKELLNKQKAEGEKRARLLRISQKPPAAAELAAYALVPVLLAVSGAFPTIALFFAPAALPLLYLLYRRLGAALPISCVGFYGLFSLVFNYDVLTVMFFCFLAFGLMGLMLAVQLTPYLLCVTVAAVSGVIGAAIGAGAVRLAEGVPLGDVAARYVVSERDDPFIRFLAERAYDRADIPDDIGKKDRGDDGYYDAVTEYFSETVHDEFELYTPYYCVHFGAVFGVAAYFIALAVNARTFGANDEKAEEREVSQSTLCLGGVRHEPVSIAEMQFPRAYLWAVLLPGLVASVALDLIGGFEALSATFMHAFVTLPPAIAFITLMRFFVEQFKGRGRIAMWVLFYLLAAAMISMPIILFVCSCIGLCDIILNLRFWTQFLRGEKD